MPNLQQQIASRHYVVNPELVAEEIIRKLRLVKWARRELVSEPDRTPPRPVHDR